jgi:hypothetical protein
MVVEVPDPQPGQQVTRAFDDVWRSTVGEIICTSLQAPNANAAAERWVGTVRRECMDQLLIVAASNSLAFCRAMSSTTTTGVARTAALVTRRRCREWLPNRRVH